MRIIFTNIFIRQTKKLDPTLQDEVMEKVDLFKDLKNHKLLKVHKLHGPLNGRYGFSVNYNYRIIFIYTSKNEVALLTVGNHDLYK